MSHINIHQSRVLPDWIDYNGHMNVAYYVLAFDHATDALLEEVGLGERYRAEQNASAFVVESHVTYNLEVHENDPLTIKSKVLGNDRKKIQILHEMYVGEGDDLCASNEVLLVHINMESRRSAQMSDKLVEVLDKAREKSLREGWPKMAGRKIKKLNE